jgi:hypothetical protein
MSRGPVIRSEAYARIPRALPHHSFDIEPRRLSCLNFSSLVRNPTVHLLVSPRSLTTCDVSACASKILPTYQGGELGIAEEANSTTNCLVISGS